MREEKGGVTQSGCPHRVPTDPDLWELQGVIPGATRPILPFNRELLTLDMRRALYDKVAEIVTASIQTGRPGDLSVHLPHGIVPGGWSLSRQLTYRLTKDT
jgi:hypothetical protein